MNLCTIFEWDKLIEGDPRASGNTIPTRVFTWLEQQARRNDGADSAWLKVSQDKGQRVIKVTNYVGVIRSPCGYQIEVLPKTGKKTSIENARNLLIKMLMCLKEFRHFKTADADLHAVKMPIIEVFIQHFLHSVGGLIARGLRGDYVANQSNLYALRGRLMMSRHLSENLTRPDRFFTEHDEFLKNRPENRLIHKALRFVMKTSQVQKNKKMAGELAYSFIDIPESTDVALDIQRIRLDRGMEYYETALYWAKLLIQGLSPIASIGESRAPSLLFPMEALFEAYVEKHLAKQLSYEYKLKSQAASHHLVEHNNQKWFRMKPDLLVKRKNNIHLVLDTKWKLLDASINSRSKKYELVQSDFYQMYAYGHHYLSGAGDIVLIYPKTDSFEEPLEVFTFLKESGMRLWVLPFCLENRQLILPEISKASWITCMRD